MSIICFLLVGFFTTWVEVACSIKLYKKHLLRLFCLNTLFVNTLSLFLLRFLFLKDDLFLSETFTLEYSIKYLLFSFAVAACYLYVKYRIRHSRYLKNCLEPRTKKEVQRLTLYSSCFLLGLFLFFGTYWVQSAGHSKSTPASLEKVLDVATILDTPGILYLTFASLYLSFLWAPFHIVTNYRTPLSNQRLQQLGGFIAITLLTISLIYTLSTIF